MKYNFSKSRNKDERTVRSNKNGHVKQESNREHDFSRIDWRNRINVADPI